MPVIPRFNKDLDYFQDVSDVNSRVTILENNEYKVLYWASVNTGTGAVSVPTGATVVLADFPSGINAITETIVGGKPSGYSAKDSGGNVVNVSTFDTSGNYTLSGTPTAYPIAVLYILQIKAKDWGNLNLNNVIAAEVIYDPTGTGVSSVGLALPSSIFDITGSPVTSSGTLTGSFKSFAQALVFASPSGASGTPSMRALVASDIPSLSGSYIPLSGNNALTPITGDIYFDPESDVSLYLKYEDSDSTQRILFGQNSISIVTANFDESIQSNINFNQNYFNINSNQTNFRGITYFDDFSANFTDQSLTNRLYNDQRYSPIPIVVSGNTTAENNTKYINVSNATYTDPTPVEGKGYEVFVRNGTATIGGVDYSNAGSIITRIFHSGAWANYQQSVNPMTTAGDLIYGGASGVPTRLPVGTRGRILQVGASSVPEWNSNILDSNGNTILGFSPTASAVNSFTIANSTGTNSPILSTPNSGAGSDQVGIGATLNLGLGTSAGQSGRLLITTGQITSTGTTVQTRYNLFQIGSLGTTSSGFILNSNGGANTLSNTANGYTMQQTSTSLLINNINTNQSVNIRINNSDILACALGQSIFSTGLSITKAGQNSSWFTALTVNGGADTNRTAATEFFMVNFNMNQTKTWLAGTVPIQREAVFQAPTYAGASATATFQTAATVAITGAPIQGSNASIAQPLSFWVQGGTSRFDGVINLNPSYVSAGTTGNRTSNTPSGNIRIAAGGTTATLTNSLIGSNTRVLTVIVTNDATAFSCRATPSGTTCVFTLNQPCTAETEIYWELRN